VKVVIVTGKVRNCAILPFYLQFIDHQPGHFLKAYAFAVFDI
jgi:hypothetical protein